LFKSFSPKKDKKKEEEQLCVRIIMKQTKKLKKTREDCKETDFFLIFIIKNYIYALGKNWTKTNPI
jgi:hypothetical protein